MTRTNTPAEGLAMRLPRPRLTIRRLMILVAMVALMAWGWTEGDRRRERFQATVRLHQISIVTLNLQAAMDDRPPEVARLAWHETMLTKYECAVQCPWLPVWPDPPVPQPAWTDPE